MKLTIGQYMHGHSILHRLDPRLKIIFMFIFMILIFLLAKPIPLLGFGVFLMIIAILSKAPLKVLWKNIRAIWFIAIFAFLVNVFSLQSGIVLWQFQQIRITTGGLWFGGQLVLRLIYLVLTSTLLLTLTTTPIKIADGLERLFKPLECIKFPAHELAMMMSIALRFIPTLAEETEKIMKAQTARGADYDTGGLIKRAKGMVTMLIPLFVSAFKRADDLALAMEARCYHGGDGRTKLNPLRYAILDAIVALCFVLVIGFLCFSQWMI